MDKKSRLKAELRLTKAGRDFLENVELPKHPNSLPIKADDRIKPYKKVDAILIPEGATNGDMLTALFGEKALITLDTHNYLKKWWDAPFKK